jgi:prolyl oligopeptidase
MDNPIFEDYLNELHKINPTINDYFMRDEWENKNHIQPNVYSEKYYKDLNRLNKDFLKRLNKKYELNFYEKIFKKDLDSSIHLEEDYKLYYYMPINMRDNILLEYVSDSSGEGGFRFDAKKDYENFVKRLKSLDGITEEIIKKMKYGIRNNVTLYKKTVSKMIDNINEILKEKSYTHTKEIKISKKEWDMMVEKYLVNNLRKLNEFLINDYLMKTSKKCGLHQYKGGKSDYRFICKDETLPEATPKILFNLGMNEIDRIKKEKKKLEKEIGKGDIDEYIKNEKSDYYTDKKDILKDIDKIKKKILKETYSKYFHGEIKKSDDYDVKEVRTEEKSHFAFYRPSDLKMKRKGAFYINTFSPHLLNKNELYVLTLHEGIPGHHYELNYHINRDVPDFFKSSNYDNYSEGWGLYCESLGDYSNPKEKYFRLKYDMLRSIRLVIDTAIHYFGWEYDKCYKFMKENLHSSDEAIHRALLRYIDNPGQALTYKIGEKTILFLKEMYLEKGGNIKDFHEIIMRIGPCPVDSLLDYFIE